MIVEHEISYRIPVAVGAALALAAIAGIKRCRRTRPTPTSRRNVLAFSAIVLIISSFFVIVLTRYAVDQHLWNIRNRWIRMGEQNILNYNQLVAGHNAEISLPVGHGGLILTNEINTDLHVELDSRGWISIHNYQLSKKRLASLLSSRVEQYGTFRMFVWADEASSFASRTELVQMLDSVGCSPLYFVEASPLEQDDRVEYRAVLW